MHELDKSRRKLEVEKEELQNGLEEVKSFKAVHKCFVKIQIGKLVTFYI